jgi:hypothetical protein
MEGVMAQFDGAGDEPNAGEESGELDKKDEDENMGGLESVEAVESVDEESVQESLEVEEEQNLLSAEATVGSVSRKNLSLKSRTKDKIAVGASRLRRTMTKSTVGLNKLKEKGSALTLRLKSPEPRGRDSEDD